jgi:hypothetical protein
MVPLESALEELSNEWSCLYVSIILHFLGNFCVLPSVTENGSIEKLMVPSESAPQELSNEW